MYAGFSILQLVHSLWVQSYLGSWNKTRYNTVQRSDAKFQLTLHFYDFTLIVMGKIWNDSKMNHCLKILFFFWSLILLIRFSIIQRLTTWSMGYCATMGSQFLPFSIHSLWILPLDGEGTAGRGKKDEGQIPLLLPVCGHIKKLGGGRRLCKGCIKTRQKDSVCLR